MTAAVDNRILDIYRILYEHFGPQHWWPGETPFEVMTGAVLTQNTSWANVSRAVDNLKKHELLTFAGLDALPVEALARMIRPSGYYNLKAARLKNLLLLIRLEYNGNLDAFLREDPVRLRERLLSVKGIGPETADSILLYAAGHPVFVVDAYTHRILSRHGLVPEDVDYHEIQEIFMNNLQADAQLFNEYHALLVRLGKEVCKKSKPLCDDCPIKGM